MPFASRSTSSPHGEWVPKALELNAHLALRRLGVNDKNLTTKILQELTQSPAPNGSKERVPSEKKEKVKGESGSAPFAAAVHFQPSFFPFTFPFSSLCSFAPSPRACAARVVAVPQGRDYSSSL